MKKEVLIWQIIIFILGLLFVLTIREHLQDKTKIEAEVEKAKCIVEMNKIFPGEYDFGVCKDIKTYKLKDYIK